MKSKYLSLLFLLLSFALYSQQDTDTLQLKEDTDQAIDLRTFDEQLSQKYQGEEFNYDVRDGEAQNLIERFLQWFFQTLSENFGIDISPEAMKILEYIIYILMGGLVIYLLMRFLVGEHVSSIFKKGPSDIIDINLSEEHIEHLDLNALLSNAVKAKDFRLAIRYQYLRTLKTLSQKSIIDWHYEKTNSDYLREINTPAIKTLFKEVSYLYDYIWYGEQPIDEKIYGLAENRFELLANQIPN
ncbi:DUF4129 domain-containing protein [Muriicola sp. Z0-33]|uniref:DUF4129 domain-containing protein n=1 Tax=Muriicola sp. Z0-33 TaxID=2816957 RepID=UPI002237C1BC|nr:DUF4129 domain-containing protein [Muriicola sp. Z0-33]MCW5517519.1 DUF4129 domain-containing protein [Muriicola sp. Z0-33]